MGDASRALLRAASAATRVDHPAARYSSSGVLSCVACAAPVSGSWEAHLGSAGHKGAIARLRSGAMVAGASVASAPAPARTATAVPAPAAPEPAQPAQALPAGFYDNPEADARARGVDFKKAQQASQAAELEEFMGWAATVAAEGEVEAAAEAARYEARAEEGAEEAALFRARAAVLRELVEGGRLVGSGNGGGSGGGGGEASPAEAELLGAASLLTGGGEEGAPAVPGAVTAAELSGLLAERLSRKRPREGAMAAAVVASDSGSDDSGDAIDPLDWRRKGAVKW